MTVESVQSTTLKNDIAVSLTLKPNYRVLVLSLFFLPLLLFLGNWQLNRASEKQSILAEYQQRLIQTPQQLTIATNLPTYTPVLARGHFDGEHQWLLDNKIRNGRVGYEIITPFILASGASVLVNRGWVQAPRLRSELPEIMVDNTITNLTGSIYQVSANALIKNNPNEISWPKRISAIDIEMMQEQYGNSLSQAYVRIDELSPMALSTDWKVINTQPEKHTAYAVQWFAMAFALCMLVLVSNSNILDVIKKKGINSDD